MKHKTKVLFLIPSLVGGGAERTLINILKNIDYSFFEIHLVVVDFSGVFCDEVPSEVKVLPLFFNTKLVRLLSFIHKKTNFNRIVINRFLNNIDSSYETAVSFLDSNFTDLLFEIPKINKTITWVHSSYKTNQNFYKFYKNKKYRNRLIKERYSKLNTIVFVSNDAKSEFKEVFGSFDEMPVIYNFMNEKEIKLKSNLFKFNKDSNLTKFISLGSLYPVKGYDLLITAAKKVMERGLNFKIDIYGQGYLHSELLEQIKIQNLESFVELKGFIANPYPLIKSADIFIMSSRSEAMPMALCEAMILGRPTIVTNCSGCREVVDYGKFGLMVDQNSKSIAEGMISLILDKNKTNQYKKLSKQRALEFNDESILNKIYTCIK